MKNYLYYFEFFSGLYESYFYQQVKAINEHDAIIKVVSILRNSTEEDTRESLSNELESDWTIGKFWNEMDLSFSSGTERYALIWIKEIDFDLNNAGKLI